MAHSLLILRSPSLFLIFAHLWVARFCNILNLNNFDTYNINLQQHQYLTVSQKVTTYTHWVEDESLIIISIVIFNNNIFRIIIISISIIISIVSNNGFSWSYATVYMIFDWIRGLQNSTKSATRLVAHGVISETGSGDNGQPGTSKRSTLLSVARGVENRYFWFANFLVSHSNTLVRKFHRR